MSSLLLAFLALGVLAPAPAPAVPAQDPPPLVLRSAHRSLRATASGSAASWRGRTELADQAGEVGGEWISDQEADLVDGAGLPVARSGGHVESMVGGHSIAFSIDGDVNVPGHHHTAHASVLGVHRTVFRVERPLTLAARASVGTPQRGGGALLRLVGPAGEVFALQAGLDRDADRLERQFVLQPGEYVLEARLALRAEFETSGPASGAGHVELELAVAG